MNKETIREAMLSKKSELEKEMINLDQTAEKEIILEPNKKLTVSKLFENKEFLEYMEKRSNLTRDIKKFTDLAVNLSN